MNWQGVLVKSYSLQTNSARAFAKSPIYGQSATISGFKPTSSLEWPFVLHPVRVPVLHV